MTGYSRGKSKSFSKKARRRMTKRFKEKPEPRKEASDALNELLEKEDA